MRQIRILLICLLTLCNLYCLTASAQETHQRLTSTNSRTRNTSSYSNSDDDTDEYGDEQRGTNRVTWGRDTTKKDRIIPEGVFQWTIDPRLGDIQKAENNDTVVEHYNSFNNTDGYNGEFSYLGNIGSPRLSRIFLNREENMPFFFLQPLTYGIDNIEGFRFSNTLSPLTNLSYHSCGNDQTGEDRLRAYFATNINKISGVGFKLDYLYGRGYYQSSQNSIFNGNLFGYYLGDRYNMHAWAQLGHQKNGENGGIEDDEYILNPQSFQQSYGSNEIPVNLTETYNRNDYQTYYLSHRYNLGHYHELEWPDSLKPKMPSDQEFLDELSDSLQEVLRVDSIQRKQTLDTLKVKWENELVKPREFISVASIIHTLQLDQLTHIHYGEDAAENFYREHYYGSIQDIYDKTKAMKIRNTVGLSMNEGFKPWVKWGLTAFVTHEYERYTMPEVQGDSCTGMQTYRQQNFFVGGQLDKTRGSLLHYNVSGEIAVVGEDVGEFRVEGTGDLNFPLFKRDTVQLAAHAYIKNEEPDFYLEHYHSQTALWDQELDMQKRMRVEGTLTNKRSKTSITVGFENIAKYTYLGMDNLRHDSTAATSIKPTDYSHAVRVMQASKNIQIFSAQLKQDFSFGPFDWQNELTYQTSSNQDALPLPAFNVFSSLSLHFRIAKVLRVELGGDIRYFTKYYAPDYTSDLGQFAVQDSNNPRVKIGNYPIINAFVNLHIKRCRIYLAVNHVNAGHGHMFLAPHYPINPMTIHWGVSWNFFN